MRCQEYTVESPGIYRYSVEFLWTNEAVIERPAAAQPTDDMQPTGLESN